MNKSRKIKEYWLTIEPYCLVSVKEDKALIYNTFSKEKVFSNSSIVIKLLEEIIIPENGMTTLLTDSTLDSKDVKVFVTKIKDSFMGDVLEIKDVNKKPFQLLPKPFFEKDIDKIKSDSELGYYFSNELMNYFSDVSIYINNACTINCTICNFAYLQTSFCTKNHEKESELDSKYLFPFLQKIIDLKSVNIHILGGDISLYSEKHKLIDILSKNIAKTILHSHYANFEALINDQRIRDNQISNISFMLLVDYPIVSEKLNKALSLISKLNIDYSVKFLLTSNSDFENADSFVKQYSIQNYELVPYFNGVNQEFITNNVFLDTNDLDNISVGMREILANMAINTLDYGKLSINHHGIVYANNNFESIGNIYNNSLFQIIYKELSKGKSWRRIRNSMPCNDCLYQYLCPSPSNLELAIDKNTICNLNK